MTPIQRRLVVHGISYFLLALGAIPMLVPLVWMLSTALKTDIQVFRFPPIWIPQPVVWNNFVQALARPSLPFLRFLANSTFITCLATLGTLCSSSVVAFALSRIHWRGRNTLFFVVVVTMLLPREVTIVPQFILYRMFHWIDTFLPLIVPSFFATPFYVFILRQYMMTLETEIDQAARIDGCNTWMVFQYIVLPQCVPALLTVTLLSLQAHWNEFMGPLVFLSSTNKFTATLGLSLFNGQYSTDWNHLMAASLIVMLPVLVLFAVAQKYFVQGIVTTGIK
ncbi:MAG: carbohydrate ABC transporter permease [Herpetosiphon sp.]